MTLWARRALVCCLTLAPAAGWLIAQGWLVTGILVALVGMSVIGKDT